MSKDHLYELIEKAKKNDKASIGRLLTYLESSPDNAIELLKKISVGESGKVHVIGFTGIPGSGKSTLISRLIHLYRRNNYRIAVIAIDPTSPLSKGALLGDRIRMQEHTLDPNVFIRSVSTRGLKGGLSFAGIAMVEVFDYIGYDKVFIETVGVGQAEIDIMNAVNTVVVVTMPGIGDEIQALKAGVMEIGDIYALNKYDKDEGEKTYEYLNFVLESGEVGSSRGWKPKLIKLSAITGFGVEELKQAIEEHLSYVIANGLFNSKVLLRRRLLAKLFIEKLVKDKLDELFEVIELMKISKFEDQLAFFNEQLGKVLSNLDTRLKNLT
ncbi:MAG: methylmalonyl Co-A mutase-associated GTPase MeaB [Nitrososphaerota archaeon]